MVVILLYFALFLGVHFLSRSFKQPGAARLFQIVICFILLFGFFGFRDITVLNDTPHYYGSYYQLTRIRSYVDSSIFVYRMLLSFEYGYQVFQHFLIKYVSKEPFTIIIVSSWIISWGTVKFIDKQTKYIALALLMLLLSGVMFDQYCLIRQSFALMFFYAAFPYLQAERWKPYTCLILCAALFHLSALVLLILPVMQKMRPCRRNVLVVFGIALLVSLLVYEMFSLLGLSDTKYFVMNIKRNTFPIAALLDGSLMLVMLSTCLFMHKRSGVQQFDKTVFWIGVFGLSVCIITPSFLSFFRLNIYTWPIIYLTFFKYASEKRPVLMTALIILAVRMAIILTFRNEWYHLIPYSFYDFSDRFHGFNMYWEK